MVKAKKFVYVKVFEGIPTSANFQLIEEELQPLKDDEILCEAEFLSVDPYMRPYMSRFPVGTIMIGSQIAQIKESKNPKFPVGSYVFGQYGWRTHTVVKPTEKDTENRTYLLPPSLGDLPRSLALGYLGMPGNTAYFGFLEICQPKKGETVVITAAGGAVGSLVGQIAKIKGCKVIGFAGSDAKCKWLTKELGFDHAFNYKTCNVDAVIKLAAPNGVDCYFDNVGGDISSTIISQMNSYGRISVCGAITAYNASQGDMPKSTILQPNFIFKQLKMEGFLVHRWLNRWMEGIGAILKWIQEGKIKYNETVTAGFENMPQAFIELLEGKNTGKAIVKM